MSFPKSTKTKSTSQLGDTIRIDGTQTDFIVYKESAPAPAPAPGVNVGSLEGFLFFCDKFDKMSKNDFCFFENQPEKIYVYENNIICFFVRFMICLYFLHFSEF